MIAKPKWQSALVVGMEKTGVAAVGLLVSLGVPVRACDTKPLADLPLAGEALARLGVSFTRQAPEVFEDADLIVLSPGVPADLPELEAVRARGAAVIGDAELAAPYLVGPTIGITGSNGKTTTTALAGHLLRECGVAVQVGGNIGTPVCAMTRTSRAGQWNVLELSSFQLEAIATFRAHVGVCLNVTPDHLDRHHTFAAYTAAKGRLFDCQQAEDIAVLNAQDATCRQYAGRLKGSPVWFSSAGEADPGVWLEGGKIWCDGTLAMEAADVPIRGRHNVENAMAALACARRAGVALTALTAAVKTFRAVEHRLEFVRQVNGVDYYNDSKATNVDATLKALDAFEGGLWVILGGKDKGSDYAPLREPLRRKARAALLIGAAAEKIAAQVEGAAPLVAAGTVEGAVRRAAETARPGDTVLLAPACASFDQFRSYEHRGSVFKELVMGLKEA